MPRKTLRATIRPLQAHTMDQTGYRTVTLVQIAGRRAPVSGEAIGIGLLTYVVLMTWVYTERPEVTRGC